MPSTVPRATDTASQHHHSSMALAMAATDGLDEGQTRVADYLDDKLQTLGDLDSLDALLAAVHAQHGLLQQQVEQPDTLLRL